MSFTEPTVAPGIGNRVRAAAAHRGITVEELGEHLAEQHPNVRGLGRTQLNQLVRNMSTPRVDQLEAIASVTGMPLWYLIAGIDGLDLGHEPRATDTVPSETLAEVRALREVVDRLVDRIDKGGL